MVTKISVIQDQGFLPDHAQNWTNCRLCHARHTLKISERSVHHFSSYRADSQTNKQIKIGKNITSLGEVINFTPEFWGCRKIVEKIFLSKYFRLKVQNVELKMSILKNFGVKLKCWALWNSAGNSRCPLQKFNFLSAYIFNARHRCCCEPRGDSLLRQIADVRLTFNAECSGQLSLLPWAAYHLPH